MTAAEAAVEVADAPAVVAAVLRAEVPAIRTLRKRVTDSRKNLTQVYPNVSYPLL